MKSYTITVNGKVYDVTVEETGSTAGTPVKSAAAAPSAAPVSASAPVSNGAEGSIKVISPFPGKVLALKANAGNSVEKGDVIMVVEAMKMENEIVAPEAGTVATVNVAVGDAIEAGDVLATLN